MVASNIKIAEGGPVPDHVHFHSIQFQLIFCTKGWVKVVYEDQGEPFILRAGDCVTQPPGIRHQVLEASDGLEVLEIGLPAEHMTTLDYQMKLPTGLNLPGRRYHEQKFCYHQQAEASWRQLMDSELLRCETTVITDSAGMAAVNVIKTEHAISQGITIQHEHVLQFYYLINGSATLVREGRESVVLHASDSFVLPPNLAIELSDFSAEFYCIEFVCLLT
jgi:quercetin dioxygenase-like cupin family protein